MTRPFPPQNCGHEFYGHEDFSEKLGSRPSRESGGKVGQIKYIENPTCMKGLYKKSRKPSTDQTKSLWCDSPILKKKLLPGWPRFGSIRLRFGVVAVRAVPVVGTGGSSGEGGFPVFHWKKGKDPHPQDKIQHLDFTKDPRLLYYKTPSCVFCHKNVCNKAVFGP